jgi:hypothetical protein
MVRDWSQICGGQPPGLPSVVFRGEDAYPLEMLWPPGRLIPYPAEDVLGWMDADSYAQAAAWAIDPAAGPYPTGPSLNTAIARAFLEPGDLPWLEDKWK